MSPAQASSSVKAGSAIWRVTNKAMNVTDLSRDDDFLSRLLVEKLGTDGIPLHVHKMDPLRRLPRVGADDLLEIIRRVRPSVFSLHAL
jgi:histone-lysine N-methyltransferase SUV420H